MPTISTTLEMRLFAALKRIASYQSPASLQRFSAREYGVDAAEALEMAYENVIAEAKAAIKGVRRPRPSATGAPASPARPSPS